MAFTFPAKCAGAVESHQEDLRARNLSPRTQATHEERLRDFGRYLHSRGLDLPDVTPFVVRQYLDHLRKRDNRSATRNRKCLAPHTIEDHWRTLKAFDSFLVRSGLLRVSFMAGVGHPKVPTLPPVFIPEDALRRIHAALDPRKPLKGYGPRKWRFLAIRNRAILVVLLDTMIRSAELRSLRVEDIDFGVGVLHVMGKGQKIRRPPFSLHAVKALKLYLKERCERFHLPYDRGPVFIDIAGKPLSKYALRGVFRMMKSIGGFEGRFFPHAIRHTGAKLSLKGGADVFSLAKVLGHKTLSVTRRYAEPDEAEIARQHRVWSPASRLLNQ